MSEVLQIINKQKDLKKYIKENPNCKVCFRKKKGLKLDKSDFEKLQVLFNTKLKSLGKTLLHSEDILVVLSTNEKEEHASDLPAHRITTLILDSGIIALRHPYAVSAVSNTTDFFQIIWENIDHIDLVENTTNQQLEVFRFYEKNNGFFHDLNINRFGIEDVKAAKSLLKVLGQIVDYKDKFIREHAELQSNIEKLFNEENYNEGIDALNDFAEKYNTTDITLDDSSFYYFNKTFGLRRMKRFDEAIQTLDDYINLFKAKGEIESYTYELKGELLFEQRKYVQAINCFAISEENYDNLGYEKGARSKKEEVYYKLKKKFLKVPYLERRIIFIAQDIYATVSDEVVILKNTSLPNQIKFPEEHPQLNSVYVCHPIRQDYYLPLEAYNETLLLERIHEFIYLQQCLGATHLEVTNLNTELPKKNKSAKTEIETDFSEKLIREQDFKPTKTPFIPNGLAWFHSELNWQKLADKRMQESVNSYKETLSSTQSESISEEELKMIKTELKVLLPKTGENYKGKSGLKNAVENLEYLITVEFEDTNKLQDAVKKQTSLESSITDDNQHQLNLERYEEEVLFMLEDDGKIDPSERKILNRKMIKFGLTESDALAIENKHIRVKK